MGPLSYSLAFLLVSCCSAQVVSISGPTVSDQNTSKARHSVTGSVVNSVTGEPIRRALVQIGASFTFTGADGHFQIDGVPEGPTYVSARKPGFFEQQEPHQQSMVNLGRGANEAVVKLMPEAKIQGRILDEDGEPIEGLQIQVMSQQIVGGRKEWQQRAMAATNENGIYRLENLLPGAYLIRTEVHPVFGFRNERMTGQYREEAYPPRFYPNSPDMSSAQPLELKPGEQAEADFTLSPVRAFSVSGSVNAIPDRWFVSVEDSEGQETQMAMRVDQHKGRFSLSAVPPGAWTLIFRSQGRQDESYYAEQPITVGSADIEGLQVSMQPLSPIQVHIVNAPEADAPGMQIQLISKKKTFRGGMFVAAPEKENPREQLAFPGVPPGKYTLAVQYMWPAQCVESAVSGDTDLAQSELVVPAGSPAPPINITIGTDCGTISGTVHLAGEKASGTVLLLSDSLLTPPKTLSLQPDGSFSFAGLAPGQYHVYALSNIDGLEYGNPQALRDFGGQQIDVAPNQKADVTLDLVSRGAK